LSQQAELSAEQESKAVALARIRQLEREQEEAQEREEETAAALQVRGDAQRIEWSSHCLAAAVQWNSLDIHEDSETEKLGIRGSMCDW
jgi:hypothetical protein